MSKVFVVTSGCYSDYGINAMFSTRKSAQKYIDDANALRLRDSEEHIGDVYWSDDARIEVFELDGQVGAKEFEYWTCGMLLDDGSMVEPARSGKRFGFPESRREQFGDKVPCYGNRPIVRVTSCKSAKHAEKMAAEARQQWLRTWKLTGK